MASTIHRHVQVPTLLLGLRTIRKDWSFSSSLLIFLHPRHVFEKTVIPFCRSLTFFFLRSKRDEKSPSLTQFRKYWMPDPKLQWWQDVFMSYVYLVLVRTRTFGGAINVAETFFRILESPANTSVRQNASGKFLSTAKIANSLEIACGLPPPFP